MKEYKKGVLTYIIGIVESILKGAVIFVIVGLFSTKTLYAIIAGFLIFLISVVLEILEGKVKFQIEGTKFRHIKGNKILKEYDLENVDVSYSASRTGLTYNNIKLYLNEDKIDALMLRGKFFDMYEEIKKYSKEKVTKVEVKK